MSSITERPRKRLTPKQRRELLRASRRQRTQQPSVSRRRKRRLSRAQRRAYRDQLARKARLSRRQLKQICHQLPRPIHDVLGSLEPAFTRPTYRRFVLLVLAAILTTGAHTIANMLRCLGPLAPGDPSSYHRFFSRDRWSSWALARRLAGMVFAYFVAKGTIELAVDDTVTEHPGPEVYGKGCHRDPVRSTHSFTAFRWGHKWVALVVLVKVPWARRRWALPLLLALYRPKGKARRHKTPVQWAQQMLRVLMRWFPDRRFTCTGDGAYGSHAFASFAACHRRQLTLVSGFSANANLVSPPPPYSGHGRPRVKGDDLPSPAAVVRDTANRRRTEVDWYGGGQRCVEVVSGSGCWFQSGKGLVPVSWVFVHDVTGTHRDQYFFTTDQEMSPEAVIAAYTHRWNIETTFEELRAFIGLETTRGWSRATVLRAEPCLFGLYTIVVLLYAGLPAPWRRVRAVDWPGKRDVTFSDAITAVRRWLWLAWVFGTPSRRGALRKLGGVLRPILLNALAPAA